MSPVKYELGFYIPEGGILHSHRRENLKPYSMYTNSACAALYVNRTPWPTGSTITLMNGTSDGYIKSSEALF
jgi:hypothetical protein